MRLRRRLGLYTCDAAEDDLHRAQDVGRSIGGSFDRRQFHETGVSPRGRGG